MSASAAPHGSSSEPPAAGARNTRATAIALAGIALVYVAWFWPLATGQHFLYGDLT